MKQKLFIQAMTKICAGLIIIGLLVFGPAGTLHYWNGWLFLGVLFLPMILIGVVLLIKRPELLEKRIKAKESRAEQSLEIKLS